jgi:hypothetical protein
VAGAEPSAMAEVSESLKDEMSAALRGDLERARQKRPAPALVEPPPALEPEPEPEPEPERRKSFLRRLRG